MLIERVHLLEVLVLDLDRHEQLDPLVVLQLVARHEGGCRVGTEGATRGGRVARGLLRVRLLGLGRLHVRELLILLELDALSSASLFGDLALLVDMGEVTGWLNLK